MNNACNYQSEIMRLEKIIASQQKALEVVYNISTVVTSNLEFKPLINKILELMIPLVEAKNAVLWTLNPSKLAKCWEVTECGKSNCPAYNSLDHRCWSIQGSKCRSCNGTNHQSFEEKLEECMECPVLGGAVLPMETSMGIDHEITEKEITIGDAICKGLLLNDPSIAVFHSYPENGSIACYQQISWLDNEKNSEPRMIPGRQCITDHDLVLPKTKIGLGLMTKKQIMGIICLDLDNVHYVSETEVSLLTNLASIVAITIENAQLYRLMEKDNLKMNVLCKEAHHRIKNNLQSLTGLCFLQLQQCDNTATRGILMDNMMRLRSIAFVHQLLSQGDSSSIDILELADKITEAALQLNNSDKKFLNSSVGGDTIFVDSQKATNIAIIINELVTNSLKHGFRDRLMGRIKLKVKKGPNNHIIMEFSDNGNGFPSDFDINRNSNLGLRIVTDIIKEDLDGTIQIISNNGATVLITFQE